MIEIGAPHLSPCSTGCLYQPLGRHPRLQEGKVAPEVGREAWDFPTIPLDTYHRAQRGWVGPGALTLNQHVTLKKFCC